MAELSANTAWVHVLADMVRNPGWADLSPIAAKIWMTMRGCADLQTGRINLGQPEIARRSGVSKSHAERAIRELVKAGRLQIEKIGRRNQYIMRDQVRLTNSDGAHVSDAELSYVPLRMKALLEEIRAAALGRAPVNITVNFVAGNQINVVDSERKALAEALIVALGEREIRRRVKEKYGQPASHGDLFLAAELLIDAETDEEQ